MSAMLTRMLSGATLLGLCAAMLWPNAARAQEDEYIHLVRHGETLEEIARAVVGNVRAWPPLQSLNRLRDPKRIPVGTRLRIPVRLMQLARGVAGVVYLSGSVSADGVALRAGQNLSEGAQLVTGDNGFVTLLLPDNSRVAVPPNSKITLDFVRQSNLVPLVRSLISIERGRVESRVIPDGSEAPRLSIKTHQAVVGVRGTVFRVALEERDATRAEVVEGSVKATPQQAGAAQLVVAAGYGMVVDQAAPRLESLVAAPDLSAVAELHTRPIVRFPFPAVAGATAFRVSVSTEEQNRTPIAEAVFALGKEAKFADIPDGDYWLSVRAIAASGLEGPDSTRKIRLAARPEPPFLMQPAPAAKLFSGALDLRWTESSAAASYHVQLASNAEFSTLIEDRTVAATAYAPPQAVPPGSYFWRVASLTAAGKHGPYSDPQSFSVLPARTALAPPANVDGKLKFNWAQDPGQHHQFQFARDAAFLDLVHSLDLDVAEVYLAAPAPGTYYARTRAIDPDGFVGPYTPVQKLEIPAPPFPWWMFAPMLLML